jgi:hypothetical protein
MSERKGYYSLVQFCPDASRLEGVNRGVVIYSSAEGELKVRISRSNQRIRRFFGTQNWSFVNRAKKAIANGLCSQHFPSVENLKDYISKRANEIQITSPRPMRISDIQNDMDQLFNRLIGEDVLERKNRVNGDLTKRFVDAGVKDLVCKSVDVDIPTLKRSIRVPYAYQNGRFNLISPVQFDPESILQKTGTNALEGSLIYEERHPAHGEMRLVVVANFDQAIDRSTRGVVQKYFQDNHVTLYSFDNLDPLLDDIRRSAAEHSHEQ